MTEQQIPKFVGALVEHQRCFSPLSSEDAQWAIQNTADAITLCVRALSGRGKRKKENVPTNPANPVIHVDRTIRPTYPSWFDRLVNPELELVGPPEFDVSKLELWLHPDQEKRVVKSNIIFEHLNQNRMLESCLNLRDLEEIQKQGLVFFDRYFSRLAVFAWKSVAIMTIDHRRGLYVPFLVQDFLNIGEVLLNWFSLGDHSSFTHPALRFPS